MKKIFIDFEFNRTADPELNLVCASVIVEGMRGVKSFWLHNDKNEQKRLAKFLLGFKDSHIVFAFGVVAEARSYLALHLNVLDFVWVDLHLEYRMILNHYNRLMYGKQLIDGNKVKTYPPQLYEDKNKNNAKPSISLAAACYKLLGIEIDTKHKDEMRDLIISDPDEFTPQQKKDIMKYCDGDVINLPALWEEIQSYLIRKRVGYRGGDQTAQFGLVPNHERATLKQEIFKRGEFAARSAIMEAVGYPIDYEATRNFSDSSLYILDDIAKDINEQFPDLKLFERKSKKDRRFKKIEKHWRAWIESTGLKWRMTKGSAKTPPRASLALDAFSDHFKASHNYPRNNVGMQLLRYLKTKQSLNGFMPGGKNSFWDSVGSDGRVRPYLGIYVAQSSRSQPSSTGFIPLKAAWMRSLIVPEEGKAIIGIDFKSQEFIIAALLSGDANMLAAYESGDVYLYFAKLAGEVPWDGKKSDYKEIRNKFKSTTLGIQYGMGAKGLASKLTNDCGHEFTQDEAQELINKFNNAFPGYPKYIENIWSRYIGQGGIKVPVKLPCGWYMFCDNPNRRSVGNCPIQGAGGSIMRQSVANAQDAGLEVIYTLHDAIYIECNSEDIYEMAELLGECMQNAFQSTLNTESFVGLDYNVWSLDLEDDETIDGFEGKVQNIYIDERSESEYKRFSQYFSKDDSLDLL